MSTYIFKNGGLMEKSTGRFEPFDPKAKPCLPLIMSTDEQPPLRSMADGKVYTSKAAMRESYRAKNNPKRVDYVEVGNESSYLTPSHKPLKGKKEEVVEAVEKAEAAINRGEFDYVG